MQPTRSETRKQTTGLDPTASTVVQSTSAVEPVHDQIAKRAYEIFLGRGGEHGHDLQDWLEAERQLHFASNDV